MENATMPIYLRILTAEKSQEKGRKEREGWLEFLVVELELYGVWGWTFPSKK